MSPSEEETLCSKCHARPAKNYICFGGTGQSVALCDECLRADETTDMVSVASLVDEMKLATCYYCGGSPCGGENDTISQITGEPPQKRWMCMPCSMEYYSIQLRVYNDVPRNLTTDEQIARIKKIEAEIDSHMADYVAGRE